MPEQFDGEGYETGPIEGDEAARHRHMYREVDRNFVPLDPADLVTVKLGTTVRTYWWVIVATFAAGAGWQLLAYLPGVLQ